MNGYDLTMLAAQAVMAAMTWRVVYEGRRVQQLSLITSAMFVAALATCTVVLVLTGLPLSGAGSGISALGWCAVFVEHWRQGKAPPSFMTTEPSLADRLLALVRKGLALGYLGGEGAGVTIATGPLANDVTTVIAVTRSGGVASEALARGVVEDHDQDGRLLPLAELVALRLALALGLPRKIPRA